MGNDYWSLDNDFRFDAQPGKIRAIELRDGTNHYNEENQESIIGAGQALRVTEEFSSARMKPLLQQAHSMLLLAIMIIRGPQVLETMVNFH